MIELPVIDVHQDILPKKTYNKYMKFLNLVWKTLDPCEFDDAWKCASIREHERWKPTRYWKNTCCTSRHWTCSHKTSTWCSTLNIHCKSFYCDVADRRISEKYLRVINKIRKKLNNIAGFIHENSDEQVSYWESFYYLKEEEILRLLKLHKKIKAKEE